MNRFTMAIKVKWLFGSLYARSAKLCLKAAVINLGQYIWSLNSKSRRVLCNLDEIFGEGAVRKVLYKRSIENLTHNLSHNIPFILYIIVGQISNYKSFDNRGITYDILRATTNATYKFHLVLEDPHTYKMSLLGWRCFLRIFNHTLLCLLSLVRMEENVARYYLT